MVASNPLWRATRLHGELQMLGMEMSERTVSRILRKWPRPPNQTWKTFLRNHIGQMVSIDFFTVPTVTNEGTVRVPRARTPPSASAAFQCDRASHRRLDLPADRR